MSTIVQPLRSAGHGVRPFRGGGGPVARVGVVEPLTVGSGGCGSVEVSAVGAGVVAVGSATESVCVATNVLLPLASSRCVSTIATVAPAAATSRVSSDVQI